MISESDLIFKPYIFIYHNEYKNIMLSTWLKEYRIIGNIGQLVFPISYYSKLVIYYPEMVKLNDEECVIQFQLSNWIIDTYSDRKYSKMYTKSELDTWLKYMREKYYISSDDMIVYQVLTQAEELKDKIERRLLIPRGLLDGKELYEVTIHWQQRTR